jgi:hypothetical protein
MNLLFFWICILAIGKKRVEEIIFFFGFSISMIIKSLIESSSKGQYQPPDG